MASERKSQDNTKKPRRFANARGTVVRVLDVLRSFGDGPAEWSLGDLAKTLLLPASTVHRLLTLLAAEGFVDIDERAHRYRIGPELYRVSAVIAAKMPIVSLAMPILHEIARQSDETTVLSLYYPKQLQKAFVAQVESTRPMRYVIELNIRHSLAWGASAHAILAQLPDETVERALSQREPSPATEMQIDRKKLYAELKRIRQEGYARSVGERVPTAIGLAVPIFGADGKVKGSLSVTYPDSRLDERLNRKLVDLLHAGAKKLSSALGYQGCGIN
jgi:IclR family acetate operon transcriptional repressor